MFQEPDADKENLCPNTPIHAKKRGPKPVVDYKKKIRALDRKLKRSPLLQQVKRLKENFRKERARVRKLKLKCSHWKEKATKKNQQLKSNIRVASKKIPYSQLSDRSKRERREECCRIIAGKATGIERVESEISLFVSDMIRFSAAKTLGDSLIAVLNEPKTCRVFQKKIISSGLRRSQVEQKNRTLGHFCQRKALIGRRKLTKFNKAKGQIDPEDVDPASACERALAKNSLTNLRPIF